MLFSESFYFLQKNFNVWIEEKHKIIDVPFSLFSLFRSGIGGVSYDQERGYLYVFELHGDGNKPLVHVWEIDKQDHIKHTLSDAIRPIHFFFLNAIVH